MKSARDGRSPRDDFPERVRLVWHPDRRTSEWLSDRNGMKGAKF